MSEFNDKAIGKYRGEVAAGYDAKREKQDKWHKENEIVWALLQEYPAGTKVLDVPVGTGRFIPYYEKKKFEVFGMDANQDMIDEAAKKLTEDGELSDSADGKFHFGVGNVKDIPLTNQSVDVSLMIRLTRWLEMWECQQALRELQRVTRKTVIFNARIEDNPYARPSGMLKAAIHPNWSITKELEIEPHYVMFEVRKDT